MSFVCVDALILALVFSDVGRVEKVGEQNKVRKVHQHAEDDVFLCLCEEVKAGRGLSQIDFHRKRMSR